MDEALQNCLEKTGWSIRDVLLLPAKQASYLPIQGMEASRHTRNLLTQLHPRGLYSHQRIAIEAFAAGKNVCLTTGTASGKTTLFQAAFIEELAKCREAKALAIYPLKALGNEQEQRWHKTLSEFFIKGSYVGRIDGNVKGAKRRTEILKKNAVVVVTPDIIHAWLLPKVNLAPIQRFLKNLRLVIIDEAHDYRGVFGSQSAFLFRRLRHLCDLVGSAPRFVAASATIADPKAHLERLTGLDFEIVGQEVDGAPQHAKHLIFIERSDGGDLPTVVPELYSNMGELGHSFIAFHNSRRQVELFAGIAMRNRHDQNRRFDTSDDENPEWEHQFDRLENHDILPYRSGYEDQDRSHIQRRLQSGTLRGVVSTSALELGIDIPSLDRGVLFGVPKTSTSFLQRIGRVGRHANSEILIINTGSAYDEEIFANPNLLLERPAAQGAMYLQNRQIQYIHVLCLARIGGEHDSIASSQEGDFLANVPWPDGFLELAKAERTGQVPIDLQQMSSEAGAEPHIVFPLRAIDAQFRVRLKQGPEDVRKGELSFGQLMREAYPGAVYRYTGSTFRVYKVNRREREVLVRKEKSYVTTASFLPTLVLPNLNPGHVFSHRVAGKLQIVESVLQIKEWICGFKEQRGPNTHDFVYPLDGTLCGVRYDQDNFQRNYFTSGFCLFHTALAIDKVEREALAELLLQSLLIEVPFEPSDLDAASDKLRLNWHDLTKDTPFLSIYDANYGSLRLSSSLCEPAVLSRSIQRLPKFAEAFCERKVTVNAATALAKDAANFLMQAVNVVDATLPITPNTSGMIRQVIKPGSIGCWIAHDNMDFKVERVYWNASEADVYYEMTSTVTGSNNAPIRVKASNVVEIPGISEVAYFDCEAGQLVEGL